MSLGHVPFCLPEVGTYRSEYIQIFLCPSTLRYHGKPIPCLISGTWLPWTILSIGSINGFHKPYANSLFCLLSFPSSSTFFYSILPSFSLFSLAALRDVDSLYIQFPWSQHSSSISTLQIQIPFRGGNSHCRQRFPLAWDVRTSLTQLHKQPGSWRVTDLHSKMLISLHLFSIY